MPDSVLNSTLGVWCDRVDVSDSQSLFSTETGPSATLKRTGESSLRAYRCASASTPSHRLPGDMETSLIGSDGQIPTSSQPKNMHFHSRHVLQSPIPLSYKVRCSGVADSRHIEVVAMDSTMGRELHSAVLNFDLLQRSSSSSPSQVEMNGSVRPAGVLKT